MKIGIITFHEAINYGAMLQAYALKTTLGIDSEIIPYRNAHIYEIYSPKKLFLKTNFKGKILFILTYRARATKIKRFSEFKNKYLVSSRHIIKQSDLSQISQKYDVYVSGSDQVFNLDCTGGDTSYLLDFVSDSRKRVSYAASFGTEKLQEKYIDIVREALGKFDALSVREVQGRTIVKDLINADVPVVVDPSMLLTKKEWKSIEAFHNNRKPFVFIYAMEENRKMTSFAKALAQVYKLEVIYIGPMEHRDNSVNHVKNAGPMEWLGLIDQAKFVVTNSFHGIAFSLIYEKEFFYDYLSNKTTGVNSRIENIIQITNLFERCITNNNPYDIKNNVNYDTVNTIINKERENALNFIKENIIGLNESGE